MTAVLEFHPKISTISNIHLLPAEIRPVHTTISHAHARTHSFNGLAGRLFLFMENGR